jgi:hypothetical protein
MSIIDRRHRPAPLRGEVELIVGEPIWFDADMDAASATTRLEAAVAALDHPRAQPLGALQPA